jgi:hypothetical protein
MKDAPNPTRVPLPKDYQTKFTAIRVANKQRDTQQGKVPTLGTAYANDSAAAVTDLSHLPYPNGSVIVFEWAQAVLGADGKPVADANGLWQKGPIARIDVMQRGKGYGEAYGDKRATEWEFASYNADGTPVTPPVVPSSCAECHAKAASRDCVFRGRFPAIEANAK